jgi:hypothetical protein
MAEETYPDGRIKLTVATEDHNLESGIKQLNPILKDILEATDAPFPWTKGDWVKEKFGRLTFSQTGK